MGRYTRKKRPAEFPSVHYQMSCKAREAVLSLAKGFMVVSMSFIVPFDLEAFSLMRQACEVIESHCPSFVKRFFATKACLDFV